MLFPKLSLHYVLIPNTPRDKTIQVFLHRSYVSGIFSSSLFLDASYKMQPRVLRSPFWGPNWLNSSSMVFRPNPPKRPCLVLKTKPANPSLRVLRSKPSNSPSTVLRTKPINHRACLVRRDSSMSMGVRPHVLSPPVQQVLVIQPVLNSADVVFITHILLPFLCLMWATRCPFLGLWPLDPSILVHPSPLSIHRARAPHFFFVIVPCGTLFIKQK